MVSDIWDIMATATGVFFMSLTAIPVSYSLNLLKSKLDEEWTLFAAGSLVLAVITFITYLIIKFTQKRNKPQDISFYGEYFEEFHPTWDINHSRVRFTVSHR